MPSSWNDGDPADERLGIPVALVILVNFASRAVGEASAKLELGLGDPQGLDAVVERRCWNTELGCGPLRACDTPTRPGECSFDDLTLRSRRASRLHGWSGGCGTRGRSLREPLLVDGEYPTRAQDHGALDHVLQLSDVARPVVRLQ